MPAISPTVARHTGALSVIRTFCSDLAGEVNSLPVAQKLCGLGALLALVMISLVVISVQSIRLQAEYRQVLASSANAAINIGRVNALIYAIVMESRGVYMSSDNATVKKYADELLRRNEELHLALPVRSALLGILQFLHDGLAPFGIVFLHSRHDNNGSTDDDLDLLRRYGGCTALLPV